MVSSTSLSVSLDSLVSSLHHRHRHFPSKPNTLLKPSFPFLLLLHHHPRTTKQSLLRPPSAFLGPTDLRSLRLLEGFSYTTHLPSGELEVRLLRPSDVDPAVRLLADSFAEALLFPATYAAFLSFVIRRYVLEKRNAIPHAATLVGYYKENGEDDGEGEMEFAATAEVSFDEIGANASQQTPLPPKNCGYICNMTVNKELRRRGIGWHLLKACETLISQICTSRMVYLHCRLIDTGPFNLYEKAGYVVYKTDGFLVWFRFQKRKHLMRKELPPPDEGLIPDDKWIVEATSGDHVSNG